MRPRSVVMKCRNCGRSTSGWSHVIVSKKSMAEIDSASLRLKVAWACRAMRVIAPMTRRRMARIVMVGLLFLLLPLTLCRWAEAHDERAKPPHLPFYVATKGNQTIYVLGTLHVGDPADYPAYQPFRAPIINALTASPALAFELSPDDIVMSQGSVNQYGVCARDCLPRMLPAALWARLAHRLRHNPAALAEIRKMKPWLASLLIETFSSLSAGLQTEYRVAA